MKYSLTSFYGEFYGLNFFRHFRRLPDLKNDKVRRQFTVKNPKQLYLQVHKNSGYHACMTHVYDHGTCENLNGNNLSTLHYDRAFFDFDVENQEVKKHKKDLKISEVMNVSLSSVESLMFRAKKNLQEKLISLYKKNKTSASF